MQRKELIEKARRQIGCLDYLKKAPKGGYLCPYCDTGTKGQGTGAVYYYKKDNNCHCFSCKKNFDALDLIAHKYNCDFNGALEIAAGILNTTVENDEGFTGGAGAPSRPYKERPKQKPAADLPQEPQEPQEAQQAPEQQEQPEQTAEQPEQAQEAAQEPTKENLEDYTEYYKRVNANLEAPAAISYLSARGISLETAAAYNIGYDPEWISPQVIKNQQAKGNDWRPDPTERIIIPMSANHYLARAVNDAATAKQFRKMNETGGGNTGLFNEQALYKPGKVFITEAAFDALSIIEAGADAIGLNSTNNANILLTELEKGLENNEISSRLELIITLDNDSAGQNATETILAGLKELEFTRVRVADICGKYKDANEALVADRSKFIADICRIAPPDSKRPHNARDYIDYIMQNDIERMKAGADVKTGFARLDRLSGGLYPGLYVIAATSSLGKTTFALQIADNLAAAGRDILFFSLEQSRLELITKSIARIQKANKPSSAINSLQIRKGQGAEAAEALQQYKDTIADRMSIIEGNFGCNVNYIKEYVDNYIKVNDCRPIIFIDYLQIMQPVDEARRQATKDIIDSTVTELKRLSRQDDLTIFVISSVNRANYLTPIDFESLKESGGIEYTADVIWGLQLQCLNDDIFSSQNKLKEKREKVREAKAENPRKIELLCLKNRYGIANFTCGFDYYPANDLYVQYEEREQRPYYGAGPFDGAGPQRI